MKVPGDDRLSNAEIVSFVDLAAAEIPGWKPSEHFDEHSLIEAYRAAQTGNDGRLKLLTTNRLFALLAMTGEELIDHYEANRVFAATVEELLGPGTEEALASFLAGRMRIIAEQATALANPESQLALFQVDAFLLGWMTHHRYTNRDDG